METTAREQMIDVLARQLHIDPLELRRRNVLHRSEIPYISPAGLTIEHVTPEECMEGAVEAIGYESFRSTQRD
jgi:carbon-monoxide dehydrogenase large subunit